MRNYLDLMKHVLDNGIQGDDRTGVGTIATFGEQLKFDMADGFPAVTTKKLAFKSVVAELLWFLRGSDNINELRAITHGEVNRYNPTKKTIWDANYEKQGKELGYEGGFVGLIYGVQWRAYGVSGAIDRSTNEFIDLPKVDQIAEMLKEAERNPDSRRLVVEALNPQLTYPVDLNTVACHDLEVLKPILPPCHTGFQVNIQGDYIDLLFKMRSVDLPIGAPFDIASYALLLSIFGRILNKTPRKLVGQFGNTHIYLNQQEGVKEQLTRSEFALPTLWINPELKTLADFEKATVDDFKLLNYLHHPSIPMPMAA